MAGTGPFIHTMDESAGTSLPWMKKERGQDVRKMRRSSKSRQVDDSDFERDTNVDMQASKNAKHDDDEEEEELQIETLEDMVQLTQA